MLRVLEPDDSVAEALEAARQALGVPVHFISGNHEDFAWLRQLHDHAGAEVVAIDPLGIFHHVADGHVAELANARVACLGKIDAPGMRFDLDPPAYDRLMALPAGSVDILVTHDNPVGVPPGYLSREGGSKRLTRLIDQLQPPLHVCGHIHRVHGPREYGRTRSYTLGLLVPPKRDRWNGEPINPEQRVAGGSLAIADTDAGTFEYVHEPWLDEIAGDDFSLGDFIGR